MDFIYLIAGATALQGLNRDFSLIFWGTPQLSHLLTLFILKSSAIDSPLTRLSCSLLSVRDFFS